MLAFLKRAWQGFNRKPEIRIIRRESSDLRLYQWRAEPNLTKAASRVLAIDDMRFMLDVLQNEHPGAAVMLRGDQADRAAQQARAEGYTMCLSNLKALGIPLPAPKPLGEPTFESETEKE